ncbi:MAG: hypothetical protein V4773_30955, partial [Verrucomicrobiota bacterium]
MAPAPPSTIDYPTLGAILVAVAASQVSLWKLMEPTTKATTELADATADKTSADRGYVEKRRRKLGMQLLTLGLLVNLVMGAMVLALWLLIFLGPERLLPALGAASAAEPLSRLEKIIYSFTALGWSAGYFLQGGWPYWRGVQQWRAAGRWLRNEAPVMDGIET